MATINEKKLLQLLRSQVFGSKDAALSAISDVKFASDLKFDGTPMAVRYKVTEGEGDTAETTVKSLFVLFHDVETAGSGYTVFDNADEATEALETLKDEISNVIGIDGIDGKGGKNANQLLADELKETTYASAATTTGETIVDVIKALDNAIVANKVDSYVDNLTIVKATEGDNKGKISTAVKIAYVPAVPASESQEAVPAKIQLQNKNDVMLSEISVSDLIGNGVLQSSRYDSTTGILHLYFKQADGSTNDVEVNLSAMLDIDDVVIGTGSTKYLQVALSGGEQSDMVLDVKMGDVTTVVGEDGNVVVSATPGLVDAEDVASAMTDAVEALEEQIQELQNTSLSGFSVNGVEAVYDDVSDTTHKKVEIKGSDIKVASAYTEVEYAEEFAKKAGVVAVAADDKVSAALAKVEGAVKVLVDEVLANEEVTKKSIEALANAAGTIDSEGVITYVKHQDNEILKNASSLNEADLLLAQAIKAAEEKSDTKVEATSGVTVSSETGVSGKTIYTVGVNAVLDGNTSVADQYTGSAGLYFAPKTAESTESEKLDVSFDFGLVTLV